MLGVIILNIKELADEVLYMFKVDSEFWNTITLNKGFYGEIAFIISVVLLTYLGFKKWCT